MERSEDCSIIMLGPKLFIIYLKHFNLLPYYIGLLKCNHENETTFKIVYIHKFEIITKKKHNMQKSNLTNVYTIYLIYYKYFYRQIY